MKGLLVFRTIDDAIGAGYTIAENSSRGCIVRTRTPHGWANALVDDSTGIHSRR